MARPDTRLVLCRVGSHRVGLRIDDVVEVMRPLPVAALAGAPAFVCGASVIRGETVPVVDAAALLGAGSAGAGRLVVLAVAGRRVALAVDAVLGIEEIAHADLRELPPLLASASRDAVRAVGTLDAELLLVLESARIVPEPAWAVIDESLAA